MHQLLGKEVNDSASESAGNCGIVAWRSGMNLHDSQGVFMERLHIPKLNFEVIGEKFTLCSEIMRNLGWILLGSICSGRSGHAGSVQ